MLFNSAIFLFVFLPLVLAGFAFAFRKSGLEAAWIWLAAASVFFYGWWNPVHVPLLLISVAANYWLGRQLAVPDRGGHHWLLIAGVVVNLGLLGWFKYWHFFASTVAALFGHTWHGEPLELPLGISFYTFHQLTYLLHCRAGRAQGTTFQHYLLYVTFFPQLIAGPIVRPMEMLPQLREQRSSAIRWDDLSIGFTLLAIGLFKKMVIADHVAVWVSPVFDNINGVSSVSFLDAWVAVLAYTFQLYFDFSAYSDMALGLARMFGVSLPGNFFSPYKALSIVDFWRRWHITLSLFLRDYLYIPLGGNRKGEARRNINLLLVMIIGGFWHGAGWTFGLWGFWHGFCLLVNHAWSKTGLGNRIPAGPRAVLSWALTFLVVIIGWTLFRSPNLPTAWSLLQSLFGLNGVQLPEGWLARLPWLDSLGITAARDWVVFAGLGQITALGLLLFAVLCLPNSLQLTAHVFKPSNAASLPQTPSRWRWQPNLLWAVGVGAMGAISLLHLGKLSEFLYFQF
ncbi:MAG TPA: MBOAT family protein [Prosthecobacter sp.]|nr:MBOAT family protein [Prosthecobacter sp.]